MQRLQTGFVGFGLDAREQRRRHAFALMQRIDEHHVDETVLFEIGKAREFAVDEPDPGRAARAGEFPFVPVGSRPRFDLRLVVIGGCRFANGALKQIDHTVEIARTIRSDFDERQAWHFFTFVYCQ